MTRRDWLLALAMAALVMVVGAWSGTRRGFWLDELFTLMAIHMPLREMVQERLAHGHLPLYFIFARLGPLLGESEWLLRLPTTFTSGSLLLILTGCLHLVRMRRMCWPLWLLMLFQPYWVWLFGQLRYMTFMLSVTALSIAAWLYWSQRPNARRSSLLALALLVMVTTHATGMLLLPGFLAALAWQMRGTRNAHAAPVARPLRWRRRLALGLPLALMLASALAVYSLFDPHRRVIEPHWPELDKLFGNLMEVVFAHHKLWPSALGPGSGGPWDDLLWALQVAVLAGGLLLGWRALQTQHRAPLARLCVALIIGLTLSMIVLATLKPHYVRASRYFIGMGLPSLLLFAAAWSVREAHAAGQRWQRRWKIALVALLAVQYPAGALDRNDHFRAACAWLALNHHDEPVVATLERPVRAALAYYGGPPVERDLVREPVGNLEQNKQMLSAALQRNGRVLYVRYYGRTDFDRVLRKMKNDGVVLTYRRWQINKVLDVGAMISREEERAWLKQLPDPHLPWGPARQSF